jgi:putative transcriptional regulator
MKALKKRRTDLNLRQWEVAERAGIPRVTYTMIELGKRNPTLKTAQKIAIALGCSIDELFLPQNVTIHKQGERDA